MCDHCGCDDHHPSQHDKHEHDHHAHDHQHDHSHSRSSTVVRIEQDVLAHNRAHAQALREKITARNARLINIIGSPGCGKTELLSKLIPLLDKAHPPMVVEGDLATDNDAARIRAVGVPVYQIETGTACHLTAHDVEHALSHLPSEDNAVIFVENVGNLVCPSMFDIGESLRMVFLSVTEGADKPEKYPVSFREANIAVITKSDLLPYVDFDLDHCIRLIADIHPGMKVLVTSAKDRSGLSDLSATISALWNEQ
jgi:hydrogenase nickel incorporation protein HypB